MSTRVVPRIAICYDYDGTLIEGNMQENSFIPKVGMTNSEFWKIVKKHAKKHNMDEVLAYMYMMIETASSKGVKFTKNSLKKHGENVVFFPGVMEWFKEIKELEIKAGIAVDHYIISSGLTEMILGSPIRPNFKYVFASSFFYDKNGAPIFAAQAVNYTTKTQYLFRINKGILNSWDNEKINKHTPQEERPQPFSRMVYIGDGATDVPAMKMLNYQGGYSIAVYPPKSGKILTEEDKMKRKLVRDLVKHNRAHFCAEANYKPQKELFRIVASVIERIGLEQKHKMNLEASN